MTEPNEVEPMTNEQSKRVEILARLDELDRLTELTHDSETLKRIAERKKTLRAELDSL